LSGAAITLGYALLIWQAGGWGVLAAGVHVAIMFSAIPGTRRKR